MKDTSEKRVQFPRIGCINVIFCDILLIRSDKKKEEKKMIPLWMKRIRRFGVNRASRTFDTLSQYKIHLTERYKGKGLFLALTSVNFLLRRWIKNIIVAVSMLTTSIVLLMKFDTKYNMFTGEYMNYLSTIALDLSLLFLWLVTAYVAVVAIQWLYNEMVDLKKEMFYEGY